MAISPAIIDDIRDRADLVGIISEYVPLKKRGANFTGCCPFHGEKTPSFSVNSQKNIWHCFGCGEGGNVYTFLMKINSWPFIEAVESVAERVGVTLPKDSSYQQDKDKYGHLYTQLDSEYQTYEQALRAKVGAVAQKYLTERGITPEISEAFHIGYAVSGRFGGRLMFPIFDIRSRCVGLGGRILDPEAKIAKYINSAESPIYIKGNHLYGLNVAKSAIQKQDQVIVVEGYMDAITCHQFGFANTVAVLGTALTENQARLLSRFTKNIVLAFDSDSAGQKATLRSLEILASLELNLSVLDLPGKDPDEVLRKVGDDKFREALAVSIPRIRYQIDQIIKLNDIETPEGKALIYKACEPILAKESAVLQEEYKKYLAKSVKIDYFTLQHQYLGQSSIPKPRNIELKSNKVHRGLKIALGLLNLSLKETQSRREVFSNFVPSDFLEAPLIALAEKLEKSDEEFQQFLDSIDDQALRNKAIQISFNSDPIDLPAYIEAFKAVKRKDELQWVKDQIWAAEKNKDMSKMNELQKKYQELSQGGVVPLVN